MLKTLYIENIAVIEKVSVDFSEGLNVLTGETGAGKSIIIDAIHAVMGQRTSKELIRTGEKNAFVSAEFRSLNSSALNRLYEFGFEDEDGSVIIQRKISLSGNGSCKINGRPASLSALREISKNLINIHGQHESYELFSPETHIDYVDGFEEKNCGGCKDILDSYREKYKIYIKLKKALNESEADERERLRETDLLTFQVGELSKAAVEVGEADALEAERTALSSSEKIKDLLTKALVALEGDERLGGIDSAGEAMNLIEKAAALDPKLEQLSEAAADAYYNLAECARSVSDFLENGDGDPERLEEIEQRLDLINRLSRKYGCEPDGLMSVCGEMAKRLDELQSFDRNRDELKFEFERISGETSALAKKLSAKRKASAKAFADRVQREMSFLDMPAVRLVPEFTEVGLYDKGIDKVELLISANPGEAPKPAAKIASGGELSRMMLAIKTVLASAEDVDTLIFDEIDTGISGSAAGKVGLKLSEVSKDTQVLCVTHQAQIASLADSHYLIRKNISNGRTRTVVEALDYEGRKAELARIIGGVSVTDTALAHAAEMLGNGKK